MKDLLFLLDYGKILLLPFLIFFAAYFYITRDVNGKKEDEAKSASIKAQLQDGEVVITGMEYTRSGKMCRCLHGHLQNDNREVTVYRQKRANDYLMRQDINPKEYRVGKVISCCYYINEEHEIIAFIK